MAAGVALATLAASFLEEEEEKQTSDAGTVTLFASAILQLIDGDEKARIRGYVDGVIPSYTSADLRRLFRMNQGTFLRVLQYIQEFPELKPAGPGRREPIPIRTQILITLWYICGTDTIQKIADRFGMSESTVIACRDKIISVLLQIRGRIITWPNPEEQQEEEQEFSKRNGFPRIIGAIDGTHIRIKAPQKNQQRYVNRKQFHSIQLQCVCRHNMLFSDVFVGYPGSVHDSRVLQMSDLWENGLTKCNMTHHILGDGGYPLRKWLLTPYRDNGHLSPQEKKYNYYHSSNRVVIERSFALLKSRFRRLQYLDTQSVSTAVNVIMAACVLHNMCILEHDELDDHLSNDAAENENRVPLVNVFNDQNAEGILKRDTIARHLV